MRVNIDEIKEVGLRRDWDLSREQLDEVLAGDRAGYKARAAAHIEAKLEKLERRVRVGARIKAEVSAACGRCLTPVSVDVPVEFEVTLVPAEEYADERSEKDEGEHGPVGGSFAPGEAEEDTYTGKVVDLDPIVREQILLALPGYPVCNEGCKGLCSVC